MLKRNKANDNIFSIIHAMFPINMNHRIRCDLSHFRCDLKATWYNSNAFIIQFVYFGRRFDTNDPIYLLI